MAGAVRCFNLVLSYKGNRYRGYKCILVFLKLKELVKKMGKRIWVKKIRKEGV